MPEGEEGRGCGRGRYRGGSCCLGSRIGEEVPLRVPRFCDECFLFFSFNEEVEREREGEGMMICCVCVCVCVCAFHNDPGSLRSPFPAHFALLEKFLEKFGNLRGRPSSYHVTGHVTSCRKQVLSGLRFGRDLVRPMQVRATALAYSD